VNQPIVDPEPPIATAGQRVLAYSIDYLIILAIVAELFRWLPAKATGLDELLAWRLPDLADPADLERAAAALQQALAAALAAVLIAQLVIEIAYFIAAELVSGGRSVGKWLVGLRVVGGGGAALSTRASVVRNLLRLVDELPASYLLGFVVMLASKRRQRLGDLAAGTVVRREPRGVPVASRPAAPT
jgi:uncharacterized RDD family membrane protein YckC